MSKIIKSGSGSIPAPGRGEGKVIEQEVLVAHEEARRVLEQAQARARAVVEEAQEEAERIRREAQESGWREGLAEWQARILEVQEEARRTVEAARPQLVTLALRVAEKLIRRRLEEDPETVVPLVEEALAAAHGERGGRLVVRVHPDDASSLERHRSRLADDPRWEALRVVASPEMARGGCRVETDFGTVDASLETQLAALERLLLGAGPPPTGAGKDEERP